MTGILLVFWNNFFMMQHLFRDDLLGMKALLPYLIIAPGFVRLLVILKLVQDPGLLILLQPGDEQLGSI
jgi:hypothetical protein